MYCIQVDVVFLLDGSYKMQEGVQSIRDFLGQFAEHLAIGPEKAHLAVIQYSDKPTTVFLLNTYTSKGDVMAEVRNINLKGGRPLNTGEALDYVKNYVFTSTSGSRLVEGIPQILILLSGGKSEDDVLVPSQRLKAAGIVIFTVGVKDADEAEMQSIAHSPNQAFMLREFSDLSPVKQQLLSTQFAQVRSQEQTKLVETVASDGNMRDIVFLLDGSDNTRKGFPAIRDFLYKMIENFYVEQKKDRVAVIQYSNVAVANFYLNSFLRKEDMLNSVRGLSHKGGRPLNTGAALKFVKENVFTSSSGSRYMDGVKQILILLSSGRSRDNVDEPASALKEFGVLVVGIGTKSSDSRELHNISHDSSFVLTVSELIELPEIQQQLLSTMTRAIVQVPTKTPTKWASRKDIVFVLDGSDGTRSGFPAMRDFVEGILEKIKLEKDRDRVSVVQYSREPGVHFYFNTYRAKKDIVNTVRGLKHKGGRPLNTGAALQYVIDNVFTASSGCRRLEGVPQLLILLSGGRSFDNVDTPAAALKELGVKVFAIGTRSSDSREMQRISQDPSHAMSVSDFTDLPSIQQQLLSSVETVVVGDVVFLLDGSDGTRSGFPAMRDFVQRVVEKLTVEENRDRVSVVQYSREPEANFYLNTYTTKENVVDAVTGLRHKGGRPLNTGAALQYVRDNVFTASSGSRRLDGVPQLLILLSGGRSFDNVDTPAAALKELGVRVFGIGTRSSDKREMQRISQDPSYALSVSEFTDLPSIQQQLLSSVEAVVVEVTSESPTVLGIKDVVFLLDGSDGTRSGFPAMRDFVQRVVEKFTVEENRDRVSVVQYSREPENHFNLNTYTTKEDIVATIEGIRHKGGRPLNTGAALQHVRDNVFNASSGSRHLEGVPQILILLNGGRSFDNVNTPASALKKLGVKVFAVGTRSSDIRELQKISYNPRFALSVSEFTDLPNVQQQLMSALEIQVLSRAPSRDVVFLLDGSDGTRAGFPAMRDFVQRVVETLAVDENKDRVALVQYSRDPAAQFYLNTFNTKDDIVNTVRGLRHKGGRPLNTGAALQYVRDNIFTASSGSRSLQGIPQMLILLSGGRSNDNVDVSASALKESGVLIFGIGTRNSSREVERIVTDPSYSQSVSEFTDIARVQEMTKETQIFQSGFPKSNVDLFSLLFHIRLVDKSIARKDVVFLLDGSDGTRSGFPAMRDFVQRVVEKLTVEENRDRVSVVQYSREPEANFYLNTYTTKENVVDAVTGLRHKGGRPLNTGAALQYVRDNVFTASSGSRRLDGVPQLLILLSGGRSFDNVDTPAAALKELGVKVFAIGTRSSDSREMQRISQDPSQAMSVSDFTDLPSIQQQLLSSVETVVVGVTTETPTVLGKFHRSLIAEKCRGYHKIPVKQCLSRISQTFRASSSNCYPLWKQWLLELLQKPQQF
uniref:VWFA domain-containing protein n=1 Tax=Esox lucius TaxID=8010 RepID=A0A3P8XXB9_ESOLU